MEEQRQHNEIYSKLGTAEGNISALLNNQTKNGEKIDRILEQTLKTNGRVTNIEEFIQEQYKINSKLNGMLEAQHRRLEEQENRHSYSMGILKALGVVSSIILIIGGYLFTLIIKDISRDSVKEVLADYEINVQ